MKWTEKYSICQADCGILHLVCAWHKGGYIVTVNGRALEGSYPTVAGAQAAAIDYGRQLLTEASAALSVLEVSDA